MLNKGTDEIGAAQRTAERHHRAATPAVRDCLFAAEAYFDAAHAATYMITDRKARAEARKYLKGYKDDLTEMQRAFRKVRFGS
jgi:hypothetical protein